MQDPDSQIPGRQPEIKMEEGVTIKRIKRKKMTLGEYNAFRGWIQPDNENPNTEGYLIEYLDSKNPNTDDYENYVSWSPKDVSDEAFTQLEDLRETREVKNDLLTSKYTTVHCELKEHQEFNAPHHFEVRSVENPDEVLTFVDFQCGPIKENGVNGCCNEDLLVMVLERLEGFQNSEFKCRENALAITKLEEALLWLRKRTIGRENKGIEGTHEV
jgi:hypothetical protein